MLIPLLLSIAAQASDCSYLRDKYLADLNPETISKESVKGQLERIGIQTKNPLIQASIPVHFISRNENQDAGTAELTYGIVKAFFADGRVLTLCPSSPSRNGCTPDTIAHFSWSITRADRHNSYGEVEGYECTLASYPTPWPIFLNADTGAQMLSHEPRGLHVSEAH